jgi:hypothetical protein
MRVALPFLLLAVLAGCTQPPMKPEPRPASDACGASGYTGLIGQNRKVLNTMLMKQEVRQIGPDMAVTADYRPDRLNIEYDRNDIIIRVSCF